MSALFSRRMFLGNRSIRVRITILTCILLLSVVLVFGFLSYLFAKQTSLRVGEERLTALTGQLRNLFSGSYRNYINSTRLAAEKKAIRQFLISGGKDSVHETETILKSLKQDTLFVQVQLLNNEKIPVFVAGDKSGQPGIPVDSVLVPSLQLMPDSAVIGHLYALDGAVYFPVIASVTHNKKPLGYIIRWRTMKASPQALEQFSRLLGTGARLYIGNRNGSLWTDMSGVVNGPPLTSLADTGIISYSRAAAGPVLASLLKIPNTDWLLSVELSRNLILAPAKRLLYLLIPAGLVIILLGIFIAWLLSRSISRPLEKLTRIASEIASGNHSSSLHIHRNDELGKLARAFNAMSVQVQRSKEELKTEAEKYKLLFEKNPMPMWIFSRNTLNILDVNEAAIRHYGYSKEEFLKLNAIEIRPEEERKKYMEHISQTIELATRSGIWKHKKKNGDIIMADVVTDNITYKNEAAKIILAHDVTERLKTEAELSRQKTLQQKLLTETRIQVQEKEREEMGQELHDNINQILASAKLYLDMNITKNEKNEMISQAREYVVSAMEEIRKLSRSLVAPSLNKSSLFNCIRNLADTIGAASSLSISVQPVNYDESVMDNNMKLMLYRIIQEQLNNILKHAAAKNATISISASPGGISLTIADDGRGFDPSATPEGIGLRNISTRVELYDGSAEIISSPGNGCKLMITVPLQQEALA